VEALRLTQALEAVLFASPEPVPFPKLAGLFIPEGVPPEEVESSLAALEGSLGERGLELQQVAGGYQLRTRPEFAPWIRRLEMPKRARLSPAAMEALAIIAYRQPLTRAEVEEVRGVDSGGVLKVLLDRELVRILGKKDVPGRPLLYGTARKFLEAFGLRSLSELPSLREVQELSAEESERDESA
jgi:segregation and condensation protein B